MKKKIYVSLSVLLGGALNLVFLKTMEFYCVRKALSSEEVMNFWDSFFFSNAYFWFQVLFVILGGAIGCCIGQRWWQIVYVEKKHWWFRLQKRNRRKKKERK